ncbi:MAG: alpha/beta hydrolase [Phycisphaerales bacterium]|nr:alpha/beta hydrolase [Phycisphaerales bacterium]
MQKIELHYKTFKQITYYKTGNGPALLLVHGFPVNVHLWRNIIPELSKEYTILLPNFFEKEGDWLENSHTNMGLLAAGLNDILVNEQVEQVILAGHSMGGYMGLEFAARYPEKLAGLSLIHSSSLGDDAARSEGRRKTVSILEQGGKRPFLKKMIPALFSEYFNQNNPDVVARQLEESVQVNDESLVAFYKAIMLRRATTEVIRTIKQPVQNIVGKKDNLAHISKELAAENLASINFVSVFEEVAHMAMLENPNRLVKELQLFTRYCWSLYESK